MKPILTLLVSLIIIAASAQQIFTVGEVYNYQIDDEFGYTDYTNGTSSGTTTLLLEKVISRNDSTNISGDTISISYEFMVHEKFTNPFYHPADYDTTYQRIITITNLYDSIISPCDSINCPYLLTNDTFTLTGCTFLSCTEVPATISCTDTRTFYVKNLGMVKTASCIGNYPNLYVYGSELVYYKNSNSTCGTAPLTSTGVREISKEENEILFYPNPVNKTITVLGIEPNKQITIINQLGEIMFSEKLEATTKTIDVSKLPGGVYFLNHLKFIKQ